MVQIFSCFVLYILIFVKYLNLALNLDAGRRTKFAFRKNLSIFQTLLRIQIQYG